MIKTGSVVRHKHFIIGGKGCQLTQNIKAPYQIVSIAVKIAKKDEEVSAADIKAEMSSIGWVLVDDIKDGLGEETYRKVVELLQNNQRKHFESQGIKCKPKTRYGNIAVIEKTEDGYDTVKCGKNKFQIVQWLGDTNSLNGLGNLDIGCMEVDGYTLEVDDHEGHTHIVHDRDFVVKHNKKIFHVANKDIASFLEGYGRKRG